MTPAAPPEHALDGAPPAAPARERAARRLPRSRTGLVGLVVLLAMMLGCLASTPWTLSRVRPAGVGPLQEGSPRYDWQERQARHLPPSWWPGERSEEEQERERLTAAARAVEAEAAARGMTSEQLETSGWAPDDEQVKAARPAYAMGTDLLGRDVFVRCMAGGGISLTIGLLAAAVAVVIGTVYGAVSGYVGGRTDAVLMRIVDVLYGLPYVLLVVLLAVAADAVMDEYLSRAGARAAWIERTSERLSREALGASWTREAETAWRATPAKESPSLRPVVREALRQEWEDAERAAEQQREAKRRALRHARNDQERAQVEAATIVEPGAIPPGEEAVDALLLQSSTAEEALRRAAFMEFPERIISGSTRLAYELLSLLLAIGGVSWLTMARVIRGQVLSLKAQPFVEAARAVGAPTHRIFLRHLLPNLVGPIIVYATLTVPQAILQESFLSFLGIGVKPPVPSWGNLAAEGIADGINPHRLSDSRWWLLVFPCVLLGCTLLALNFVGEGLREALDPKRTKR